MNEEIKEMETMENQVTAYGYEEKPEEEKSNTTFKYLLAAGITVVGIGLGKKLIKKVKSKKDTSNGKGNEEEIAEYLRSKGYTVKKELEDVVDVDLENGSDEKTE